MIYYKEDDQSQEEYHELVPATTQNEEKSLDESLTYAKTRLQVATTRIHTSTPDLMDKTNKKPTYQNLIGEKNISLTNTISLHSSLFGPHNIEIKVKVRYALRYVALRYVALRYVTLC